MTHHPILQQVGFGTSLPTHQTQIGALKGRAVSLFPEWGLPELFLGVLGIPWERRCSPVSLMTLSAHSGPSWPEGLGLGVDY